MTWPLLPYSQYVYDLRKTLPDAYGARALFRYRLCDLDSHRLREAWRQVVRHHPVFSMRMDGKGQTPVPVENELQVPHFKTVFSEDDTYGYVEMTGNRILMDGYSLLVLMEDWYRAYNRLPLGKDDYTGYLQALQEHSQTETCRRHKEELTAHFASLSCPLHPMPDIPLTAGIPPAAGEYTYQLPDIHRAVGQVCRQYVLPADAVFAMAVMLAMMDYNHTREAALTWAYADRDSPETARIVGAVHKDIPLRLDLSDNRETLFREMRGEMRFGIAHSDYPLTLLPPFNAQWNNAANLLNNPQLAQVESLPLELVTPAETTFQSYAFFDILIEQADGLSLGFRYSSAHYREESVSRFAELAKDRLLWLTGSRTY